MAVLLFFNFNYFSWLSRESRCGLRTKKIQSSRLRAAFFVPEIQYLLVIPVILTLSRSTDINVHLPTDVSTDDGISGSIMVHRLSGEREFVFIGDHKPRKPMSENTVNKALRVMGYDTKVEVCGHGFKTMVCSSLIESGLWSRDAVERQMSHVGRNSVRAGYIYKPSILMRAD